MTTTPDRAPAFTFDVDPDACADLFRERAGQHHHDTLLAGTLTTGIVRIGDHLTVPLGPAPFSLPGTPSPRLIATVRGFDGPDATGFSVRADDGPRRVSLLVGGPAPPRRLLAAGIAAPCDPTEYPAAVVAAISAHPAVFFHCHDFRPSLPPCLGCRATLTSIPGVVTHLRRLLGHEDSIVVDGVRDVLAGLHRR